MPSAPIPENDAERVAALHEYKILDTAAEEIFDNITSVAAKICGTPISLITLIDQSRQWLKSNTGLPGVTETPRETAMCAYTILGSDILEIKDTRKDERFSDNPYVKGDSGVQFYAGVPLSNPDGFNLGSLCVIDHKPNELNDEQREYLKQLSKIVIALFEAKKNILKDLEEREKFTEELTDSHKKLQTHLNEQKAINEIINLFSQMNDLLQSCHSYEEAYVVISQFCQKIFPHSAGSLYLINDSHEYVEPVKHWKNPLSLDDVFVPDDCWALRRGQPFWMENIKTDLICNHLEKAKSTYVCLPLIAQGETLGLLSLEHSPENKNNLFSRDVHQLFAMRMAEQIALSLANIKLRQKLHMQSISDPLTGLYNRRHMKDVFKRALIHAIRKKISLGVIMVDIDHFKKFNDTYGHDLGDIVLQKIAYTLKHNIGPTDLAFRLGGEEFSVLMQNCSLDTLKQQAEKLREIVSQLEIKQGTLVLNNLTISMGLSLFPTHGETLEELLSIADKALYQAKESGRNRVIVAK